MNDDLLGLNTDFAFLVHVDPVVNYSPFNQAE